MNVCMYDLWPMHVCALRCWQEPKTNLYKNTVYPILKNRRSEVFPLPEVLERLYWDDKNP